MELANVHAPAPAVLPSTAPPGELRGVPDGPDLRMPNGIVLRLHRLGEARVERDQVRDALLGIMRLPQSHQRLVAALGIPIELVPVASLEQVRGTDGPVVGATRVSGPIGSGRVEAIRVAARQAQVGTSVTECVQHEIGHLLAVTALQDLGEELPEAYAERY